MVRQYGWVQANDDCRRTPYNSVQNVFAIYYLRVFCADAGTSIQNIFLLSIQPTDQKVVVVDTVVVIITFLLVVCFAYLLRLFATMCLLSLCMLISKSCDQSQL